jgi:hypothetical protein
MHGQTTGNFSQQKVNQTKGGENSLNPKWGV